MESQIKIAFTLIHIFWHGKKTTKTGETPILKNMIKVWFKVRKHLKEVNSQSNLGESKSFTYSQLEELMIKNNLSKGIISDFY